MRLIAGAILVLAAAVGAGAGAIAAVMGASADVGVLSVLPLGIGAAAGVFGLMLLIDEHKARKAQRDPSAHSQQQPDETSDPDTAA
jgi:hypothetical protein